jgi:Rubrerythrin
MSLATQPPFGKDSEVPAIEPLDHVERFARDAGPIDWDPAVLAGCRLGDDVGRVLAVAALLEEDTAISADQARALGMDRAPDVAAFLPSWAAEESEHARALRFLISDHPAGRALLRPGRTRVRRRGQALVPARPLGRFGPTSVAFCSLGAAAEYVAIVIYTELAKVATDVAVVALLRSITRQEGRHLAFFLAAAQLRAAGLPGHEQPVARHLVGSLWTPVGMASLGRERWWAEIGPLLERPGVRARVERMDRVVDAVPHLAELRLMTSFLETHDRPQRPPRRGARLTRHHPPGRSEARSPRV